MSKRNVTCIKPPEPSFLRKLKEQVGYKAGPTVDTKREQLPRDDDFDDDDDKDDEKPVIVVLKSGDLTEEEANQYKEESVEPVEAGKIKYVKPEKRKNEDTSNSVKKEKEDKKDNLTKNKKMKKSVLLSFDVEENDD